MRLASQRTAILSRRSWAELFFQGRIIYQNVSTQTLRFIVRMKIVTVAEASQFKSMRFRNYCKFSCTSGSAYPRASFSSPESFSLGHSLKFRLWVRRLKGEIWLASPENSYFAEVEQFSPDKIILSTYVNTNISFLRKYFTVKIVTGAKASQFKSMRFRNYCKFSCTSCSVSISFPEPAILGKETKALG
jgi:hypothetical protein